MSGGEEAYLIMVLVAVAIFTTALAWASWHSS
jgi:hypothetical protein